MGQRAREEWAPVERTRRGTADGVDPGAETPSTPPDDPAAPADRRDRDVASRRADSPMDLSRDALWSAARNVQRDLITTQAALMSAGIAFRAFLALFPALVVAMTATALAQPAAEIEYQARRLTIGLPALGRDFVIEQVGDVLRSTGEGLRVAFVVSLVLAIWAASSALHGTLVALTLTQDEHDDRSWVEQRVIALKLAGGAVPFVVVSIGIITGVPVLVRRLGLEGVAGFLGVLATLVVLALMMVSALTVLYRIGPARRPARVRWLSPGAITATLLWLAGSQVFKVAVENLGSYDARYGAVAGPAVIMLWLWLTSWCVLVGAIINARLEHQTARDSTTGPARPLGQRDAVPADTHPDRPASAPSED